jgi:hypothetical protein
LRLKGWGSPNSNEGTYTVVLYIYKYFVELPLRATTTFEAGVLPWLTPAEIAQKGGKMM